MDINKIKPYENNAKVHTDEQLEKIAKLVKEVGWRQSIVVDKNGIIVVGHGRWFAYQKYKDILGLPEPKIDVADDLNEIQINLYRIADNKLNESSWDYSKIQEELKKLDISKLSQEIKDQFSQEELAEMLDKNYVELTGFITSNIDEDLNNDNNTNFKNSEVNEKELGEFIKCPKCNFLIKKDEI